jgi:hypothetical protein
MTQRGEHPREDPKQPRPGARIPAVTPEDPAQALEQLGYSRAGDSDTPPPSSELRAAIARDLEDRQGPFRRKSFFGRYWPGLATAAVGVWWMLLWPESPWLESTPVAAAAFAGLAAVVLAVFAACLAPMRPRVAERLSVGALVAALGALGAEVWLASGSRGAFELSGALHCGAFLIALGVLPFGLLLFQLWRSGVPGRLLHTSAVLCASLCLGGVAVWRQCPANEPLHILTSHVLTPLLLVPLLAFGVYALLARRRVPIVLEP